MRAKTLRAPAHRRISVRHPDERIVRRQGSRTDRSFLETPGRLSDARERELLRIVIVGHVDHGKSTLVGRILHETGALRTASWR